MTYQYWVKTGTSGSGSQTSRKAVAKKISGQIGGMHLALPRYIGAKKQYLQVFCSALGRTRTCGLLIRSERLRGWGGRRVPFGPYLRALCSEAVSLGPHGSPLTRAYKW